MRALTPTPTTTTWRARVWAGPAAATRSGRRAAKTALLLAETLRTLPDAFRPIEHGAPPDLPRRARRLQWLAENLCALHGVHVELDRAIAERPAIVVANHVGYLDPLAITSRLACISVAKREVAAWPLFGDALARLGGIFVRRGDAHDGARALLRMRAALERGVPVVVFPEGLTSRGDEVLPLRRGAFGLAARLGVPVVPVGVRYDTPDMAWVGDAAFVPHYVRTAARQVTRVSLSVGEAFVPSPRARAATIAADVRELLVHLSGSLG